MTPLRVLYLIDSLGAGGAQRQLVTLVRALNRVLVIPEIAVYHPLWHFAPELDGTNTPVHVLGNAGARDPRVLIRLVRLLGRERYDLLHSYLRTPGVLARLGAATVRGTRVIVSERNVDIARTTRRVAFERFLASRADAMIANAKAVKLSVETHVPAWVGRVHVVPNGLEWSTPSPEELAYASDLHKRHVSSDQLLLGVVARVEKQKNPHLLLDALELVPTDVLAGIRVLWVGARNDRDLVMGLMRRIEGTALSDAVRIIGPTDRIAGVYEALDGLVLPSSWEGFPNAVLEALAHGVPVIATDVGDVRELVHPGRSGWVVPPGDAVTLAAAICEFVALPASQRQQMGAQGSAFVLREYSVDRMVERTMAVYRHVLDHA